MKQALISYNPIPFAAPYKKGVVSMFGQNTLLLPETFAYPCKSPQSVTAEDENFVTLMNHAETLERITVFAGKKESGALEIIRLFSACFNARKHVLFFLLCDHDEQEKLQLLNELGFGPDQWKGFKDGYVQCREWEIMIGLAHYHAACTQYAEV